MTIFSPEICFEDIRSDEDAVRICQLVPKIGQALLAGGMQLPRDYLVRLAFEVEGDLADKSLRFEQQVVDGKVEWKVRFD